MEHGHATTGGSSVSSRFVSQTELTEAQQRREEQVRAAYARLGQEPPAEELAAARGEGVAYDPRTLYERLKANKDAKQEVWDEKMKLSNQFRGIDDGESAFLADVAREKREAERRKEQEMREELEAFRRAALAKEPSPPKTLSDPVAAKEASPTIQSVSTSQPAASKSKAKRKREGLLGVVKKKPATDKVVDKASEPSAVGSATEESATKSEEPATKANQG